MLYYIVSLKHVTKHVTPHNFDMIAKLILFNRSDGGASFKMKLTDKGKRGYESVEVPFTKKDWNYSKRVKGQISRQKEKNELKKRMPSHQEYESYLENKKFVNELENKYQEQIDKLIRLHNAFSFGQVFKNVKNPKKEKPQTFYSVFKEYIKKQNERGSYSNASNIKGTLNKLEKHHAKDLLFNEVDTSFLMKFRKSMEDDNLSKNTISIHLRNIRTVYNYAIKKLKVASLADYPFIDSDIQGGLKTAHRSRAITFSDVASIRDYRQKQEVGSEHWNACSMFIFGYAGRGINFVDIARLRWDNFKGGRIYFTRHKTRSKIIEETSFPVTKEMLGILKYFQKTDRQLGNPYIFPILNASHQTEKSKLFRTEKMRKELNMVLKDIGKKLEIQIPITTYVWRHTFAAVAKNDLKVDVALISEMLGHHDLNTTKYYLKNFPDTELDKATAGL